MTAALTTDAIGALRRFNRFYTRELGLLGERLSDSPFSLTEARVLYELARRASPTAAELARDLRLDPAYLSRILKRFSARRLLLSAPSAAHAKRKLLSLTPAGRDAFAALERATIAEIGALLRPLGETSRRRLVGAAQVIEETLEARRAPDAGFVLRAPAAGDLGWVIHRQAALYASEYGWDWTFEGLAAEILGDFVGNFEAARERAWIAARNGEIVGSIFLMRGDEPASGKLRLLYVEPEARRLGIGAALIEACVTQARQAGYRRLALWTNDVLTGARRLYQAAGFQLVSEKPHESFGKKLVGQIWALDLPRDNS
jgi:DNA-binding MarR family transcriptional regulator/N-acetylglutamate synthase-like GNAT family acetyltransferase